MEKYWKVHRKITEKLLNQYLISLPDYSYVDPSPPSPIVDIFEKPTNQNEDGESPLGKVFNEEESSSNEEKNDESSCGPLEFRLSGTNDCVSCPIKLGNAILIGRDIVNEKNIDKLKVESQVGGIDSKLGKCFYMCDTNYILENNKCVQSKQFDEIIKDEIESQVKQSIEENVEKEVEEKVIKEVRKKIGNEVKKVEKEVEEITKKVIPMKKILEKPDVQIQPFNGEEILSIQDNTVSNDNIKLDKTVKAVDNMVDLLVSKDISKSNKFDISIDAVDKMVNMLNKKTEQKNNKNLDNTIKAFDKMMNNLDTYSNSKNIDETTKSLDKMMEILDKKTTNKSSKNMNSIDEMMKLVNSSDKNKDLGKTLNAFDDMMNLINPTSKTANNIINALGNVLDGKEDVNLDDYLEKKNNNKNDIDVNENELINMLGFTVDQVENFENEISDSNENNEDSLNSKCSGLLRELSNDEKAVLTDIISGCSKNDEDGLPNCIVEKCIKSPITSEGIENIYNVKSNEWNSIRSRMCDIASNKYYQKGKKRWDHCISNLENTGTCKDSADFFLKAQCLYRESDKRISKCGNAIKEESEQCDDGNPNENDGCDLCVIQKKYKCVEDSYGKSVCEIDPNYKDEISNVLSNEPNIISKINLIPKYIPTPGPTSAPPPPTVVNDYSSMDEDTYTIELGPSVDFTLPNTFQTQDPPPPPPSQPSPPVQAPPPPAPSSSTSK